MKEKAPMTDISKKRQIDQIDTRLRIALANTIPSGSRGAAVTSEQLMKVAQILWEHTLELARHSSGISAPGR